jgi:hypothetical protein
VLGLGDDRTDHDLLDALRRVRRRTRRGLAARSTRSDGRRDDVHIVGPGEVRAFLRDLVSAMEPAASE